LIAVIGLVKKYLSPASLEADSTAKSKLVIKLAESDPFAIWCAHGKAAAKGISFEDRANGLFIAQLPVKKEKL